MRMDDIRQRAKDLGVGNVSKQRKGELIRSIQRQEGNFDCFGSEGRFDCPQEECCWRTDCLSKNPG